MLDDDTVESIHDLMHVHGVSFDVALNDAIRAGERARRKFRTTTTSMGRPSIDLDRALQLAAELEDADRSDQFDR